MSDEIFNLELPKTFADEDGDDNTPSGWRYLSQGGIKCVFSTSRSLKMGMGVSAATHRSQNYVFVEQVGDEEFEVRVINNRHVPASKAEPLAMEDLISDYKPEVAYYEEVVWPAMVRQKKVPGKGGDLRERVRLDHALAESEQTVAVDERGVKGLFGLALIYLSRGEVDRAREFLAELVNIKASFEGKNQHLFNEFGIELRKSSLFPEAVEFFQRALEFVEDDEHLYYNLARAHYENGDWNASLENLILSHRLNPELGVARNLFEVMVGLETNEALQSRFDKPPVPPNVAARARQILAAGTGRLKLDEEPIAIGIERGRARSGGPVGVVEFKKHGSDE